MLIRIYGLRRHIWMGVSELEAGFLSGEARLREIPESLRHTPQHGRSQLHVSPLPDRKAFARLDRSHARGVSVRHQGAPENYARRALAQCCRFYFRFCALAAAAGRREKTWARAVPIAAILEVRCLFAEGFSGRAAQIFARRI